MWRRYCLNAALCILVFLSDCGCWRFALWWRVYTTQRMMPPSIKVCCIAKWGYASSAGRSQTNERTHAWIDTATYGIYMKTLPVSIFTCFLLLLLLLVWLMKKRWHPLRYSTPLDYDLTRWIVYVITRWLSGITPWCSWRHTLGFLCITPGCSQLHTIGFNARHFEC